MAEPRPRGPFGKVHTVPGTAMGRGDGHEEREISLSEAQERWTQMKTGLEAMRRIWAECGSFSLDPASEQATVSADPLSQARRGP